MAKVRLNIVGPFGKAVPFSAQAILDAIAKLPRKPDCLQFAVPSLPVSVNKMYIVVGHRRVLSPDAQTFRKLVTLAVRNGGKEWKPDGAVMALYFFESPHWVSKKHEMKDADCDNRLKDLSDAIQLATGVRDNTNWEIHAYKIPSPHTRTLVYLFSLGDVVNYYQ